MKFAVAAVLAATGVSAYAHSNVTVVTEVVSSYVTYCPGPTQITHGDITYTVTEATTLTITDCPCTITKPVTTTSAVVCHTCVPEVPTSVPVVPAPPHNNATIPVPPPAGPSAPSQPGAPAPPPTTTPPPASGAGKAMALSGAGLAGVMALAAFL